MTHALVLFKTANPSGQVRQFLDDVSQVVQLESQELHLSPSVKKPTSEQLVQVCPLRYANLLPE